MRAAEYLPLSRDAVDKLRDDGHHHHGKHHGGHHEHHAHAGRAKDEAGGGPS